MSEMTKKQKDSFIRRMGEKTLDSLDRSSLSDEDLDDLMRYGYITADKLKRPQFTPRDHTKEYSSEEMRETLSNIGPRRARGYVRKVLDNPNTNPRTKSNIRALIESEPQLLGQLDIDTGSRSNRVPSLFVEQSVFQSMGPRKRFYFGRLRGIGNKDLNCRYGLKVMTSETSSKDDKKAITELTNEYGPELFGTKKRRFFRRSVERS